jgi:hypothetical protein
MDPNPAANMQLTATYFGFIPSTFDALILVEAVLRGKLNHVARRPHDRERDTVIKSGTIFIYEEHSSGIKRWTDGIQWSPSRILGNFLIYRQLERGFEPGQKKKALKKPKQSNGVSKNKSPPRHANNYQDTGNSHGYSGSSSQILFRNAEQERSLVGSLTDSYDFLENGLVKKTISVDFRDVKHHVVSYYTLVDAMKPGYLKLPSQDPELRSFRVGEGYMDELMQCQGFRCPIDRSPIDESESMDRHGYSYASTNPGYTNHVQNPASQVHPAWATYQNGPSSTHMDNGNHPYTIYSRRTSDEAPVPGLYRRNTPSGSYSSQQQYNSGANVGAVASRAQMPTSSTAAANRGPSSYQQDQPALALSMRMSRDSGYGSQAEISPLPIETYPALQGQNNNGYQPNYRRQSSGSYSDTWYQSAASNALSYQHGASNGFSYPGGTLPAPNASSYGYSLVEGTRDQAGTPWTSATGNSSIGHGHFQQQSQWNNFNSSSDNSNSNDSNSNN